MNPFHDEIHPLPYGEFCGHILNLYRSPMRARATYIGMRRALDLLGQLGTVKTTADLTTTAIGRFVASRAGKENPNTTRSHLSRLGAACSIAEAEGWCRISPFRVRKVWVRGVTPRVPRIHSREEIARVLARAKAEYLGAHGTGRFLARRLYALAATVAYTGMRRTEALTLRIEDIDLDARMILLKARVDGLLKTDAAAQPLPMPDALAEILGPWIESLASQATVRGTGPRKCSPPNGYHSWLNVPGRKPLNAPRAGVLASKPPAGSIDDPGWIFPAMSRLRPWTNGTSGYRPVDALKALGKRAGVEGLTFQSLRHSFATHCEFWGLSDLVIQRILRHTNSKTQQRYRHAETNNLRELVREIDFETDQPGDNVGPLAGAPAERGSR